LCGTALLSRSGRGNGQAMKRRIAGLATTAVLSAGLGLAGLGLAAGTAQAEPDRFPAYHWCPGDDWHPEWGDNWDGGVCHDDFHRDMDGNDHSRDWGGRDNGRDDRGGPPPWQPWLPWGQR
jgi:hypothetical protein